MTENLELLNLKEGEEFNFERMTPSQLMEKIRTIDTYATFAYHFLKSITHILKELQDGNDTQGAVGREFAYNFFLLGTALVQAMSGMEEIMRVVKKERPTLEVVE
ncbi:hypothetical protein [Candidatus Caldatribacterium sp.]|uniref:hypothetical protein n=1 Tax=Candidatus Caldatribacterium sp. TaxID=2282143 RepID=UPI00383EDE87|nr:hypothetical protein [Candidatus Caldatribacterium sp.]